MSDELPMVTVIIPTRPGQAEVPAARAAATLNYPTGRLEILIARGSQPAVQRNAALGEAKGELIYFLDDDSVPERGNLRRAVKQFEDETVQMAGGPNLCPDNAPWIERVFAVVLASWLAFGPSRARYEPVGATRLTSEKELILCNLVARKSGLDNAGGFDEALYPNEENALMDDLQQAGGKLIYDPELVVYRRPRPGLASFARMLFHYGRGRAEQFRLHPTPGSALNFVPPLFCLYLLAAGFLGWVGLVPLGFYAVAVAGQTLVSLTGRGGWRSLPAAPLIVLTHIFYGLGFWRGLVTRLSKGGETKAAPVTIERVGA